MENFDNNQNNSAPVEEPPNQEHQIQTVAADEAVGRNGEPDKHCSTEWTEKLKKRLVEIDDEEREDGKGFMIRTKQRWEEEYPHLKRSKQLLRDNARRFRDEMMTKNNEMSTAEEIEEMFANSREFEGFEGFSSEDEQTEKEEQQWDNEKKMFLIMIDEGERSKGRGFMERVKEKWDEIYPATPRSSQSLRDNASRFKKEKELINLIEVKRRQLNFDQEITEGPREEEGIQIAQQINEEQGSIEEEIMTEDEMALEEAFHEELITLEDIEDTVNTERERLPKIKKMPPEIRRAANKILKKKLAKVETVNEVVDKVYAMGKAVARKMGIKTKSKNKNCKKKGNRREMEKLEKIKELRQKIAWASNEIHRRKTRRKATKKEKEIIKKLTELTEGEGLHNFIILKFKEKWLDELRYEKIKLEKMMERGQRIRDNNMFREEEALFYKQMNRGQHTGKTPDADEFVKFWGAIWESEEKTNQQPWMENIKKRIEELVTSVKEIEITEVSLRNIIKKRKNWSAPGADGIQNYWWKTLNDSWHPLIKIFKGFIEDPKNMKEWFTIGMTILLPKTLALDDVADYRPITCLNTLYKIFTGLIAEHMKEHAEENNLWDKCQLGAQKGVLGTTDQLLIDNCILEEVKENGRNLAVSYYDYKKAYDRVYHDWMLIVFKWMKVDIKVYNVIKRLLELWQTKLYIRDERGKMATTRIINIRRGFLQGDSLSAVGFCLTEVPIGMMMEEAAGYMMGEAGRRVHKRTHTLFIDDLKVYSSSHKRLQLVNETITRASLDIGAAYGVKKCAEIVIEKGVMVKGEGLDVLEERMKCLDPQKAEIYKFLGLEQSDTMKKAVALERVKEEMKKRLKRVLNSKLSDKHLIKAINTHIIPVAAYMMNVCYLPMVELKELDMIVKRMLREKYMHGRQGSNERLYIHRDKGGRGLKSLEDVFVESKIRIASYLCHSADKWLTIVWERDMKKEFTSIHRTVEEAFATIGVKVEFGKEEIMIEGRKIDGDWKKVKGGLQEIWKKGKEKQREEDLIKKKQQGQSWEMLKKEDYIWMKSNINPMKTSAIINMQEQMVETKSWKKKRNLIEDNRCRMCGEWEETVQHLTGGCTPLAGKEYLNRHNKALMVLAVAWAKKNQILPEDAVWYKIAWEKGTVLEKNGMKLVWDFEFKLRKTNAARRPDLILEDMKEKKIWMLDMSCPMEINKEVKRREKLTKYQQLIFEMRERRQGYHIFCIPVIIGCLGGGIYEVRKSLKGLFGGDQRLLDTVLMEMSKTVVFESESILRKVLSGLMNGGGE